LKLFDRKQLKIIIFDDFKKDHANVYEDVLKFLEVDPSFKPNFKILNPNEVIRSRSLVLFRSFLKIAWKTSKKIYPKSQRRHREHLSRTFSSKSS